MTNEGWARFWTTLRTMFPAGEQDMTEEQKKLKAQLYRAALDHISDEDADRTAMAVVRGERSSYMPAVATLLDYAIPKKPDAVVRVENKARAQEVYEDIIASFEGGGPLSSAKVEAEFGYAAKVAFGAAGGYNAFAWCEPRNEPFRRKSFIEAFEEVGSAEPSTMVALPPAEPVAAIGAGDIFTPRVPELPQTKREHIVLVPPKRRVTQKEELAALAERDRTAKPITDSEERRALLKAQAEEITKTDPEGGKS